MSETKTLEIRIVGDASSAEKSLNSVGTVTEDVGKKASKMTGLWAGAGAAVGNIVGNLAVKGFSMLGDAVKGAFSDAANYNTSMIQFDQQLKNIGASSNMSGQDIMNMTDKLESRLAVPQEELDAIAHKMLQFGVTTKAGLQLATTAVANMAAATGKSGSRIALAMGKVLQDPAKNYKMLESYGVKLNNAQIKHITLLQKEGHLQAAQNYVLGIANKKTAGLAAAQDPLGKAIFRIKDAFSDFVRDLVRKLLPTITKVAAWVAKKLPLALNTLQKDFKKIQPIIMTTGKIFMNLLGFLARNWKVVAVVASAFLALGLAVKAYQAYQKAAVLVSILMKGVTEEQTAETEAQTAALILHKAAMLASSAATKIAAAGQAALNVVMGDNPIGAIVLAITALVGALVLLYKKNKTFRDFVQAAWHVIGAAFSSAGKVIGKVFGFIKNVISDAVGFIRDHWKLILALMAGPIVGVVLLIKSKWGLITGIAKNVWNGVVSAFRGAVGDVKSAVNAIWNGIHTVFVSWPGKLAQVGVDVMNGLIRGFESKLSDIKGWISDFTNNLPSWVKKILGIHSPSKVFAEIGKNIMAGLSKGIKDQSVIMKKDLLSAIDGAISGIKSKISSLNQARSQLAQSITSGLRGSAGISGLIDTSEGADNSARAVTNRFADRLNNIKQFMTNVRTLAKKGLSHALIGEILALGSDEGLPLTQSLLSQPSTIAEFNKIQAQITSMTSKFGQAYANAQYGSQIRSQQRDLHAAEKYREYVRHSNAPAFQVNVHVAGNVTTERGLVKALTPIMRDELKRIEKRNASRSKN